MKFKKPDEILTVDRSLKIACNNIAAKLENHEFEFKPDFTLTRHANELKKLLRESNWNLIFHESKWEIKPI